MERKKIITFELKIAFWFSVFVTFLVICVEPTVYSFWSVKEDIFFDIFVFLTTFIPLALMSLTDRQEEKENDKEW